MNYGPKREWIKLLLHFSTNNNTREIGKMEYVIKLKSECGIIQRVTRMIPG
jgi:hypothetical protein